MTEVVADVRRGVSCLNLLETICSIFSSMNSNYF